MNKHLRNSLSVFLSAALTTGALGSSPALAKWSVGDYLKGVDDSDNEDDFEQKLSLTDGSEADKTELSKALNKANITEAGALERIAVNHKELVAGRTGIAGFEFDGTVASNQTVSVQAKFLENLFVGPDGTLLRRMPGGGNQPDKYSFVLVPKSAIGERKKLSLSTAVSRGKLVDHLSVDSVKRVIGDEVQLTDWTALKVDGVADFVVPNSGGGNCFRNVKNGVQLALSTNINNNKNSFAKDELLKVYNGSGDESVKTIEDAYGAGFRNRLVNYTSPFTDIDLSSNSYTSGQCGFIVNNQGNLTAVSLHYAPVVGYLFNPNVSISKKYSSQSNNVSSIFNVSVNNGNPDNLNVNTITNLINNTPGAKSFALAKLKAAGDSTAPADRLKFDNEDAVLAYDKLSGKLYAMGSSSFSQPKEVGTLDKGLTLAQVDMILETCHGIDLPHVYLSDYNAIWLVQHCDDFELYDVDRIRFKSGKFVSADTPLEDGDPGVNWYKLSFFLSKDGGAPLGSIVVDEAILPIKGALSDGIKLKDKLLRRYTPDAVKILLSTGVLSGIAAAILFREQIAEVASSFGIGDASEDQAEEEEIMADEDVTM